MFLLRHTSLKVIVAHIHIFITRMVVRRTIYMLQDSTLASQRLRFQPLHVIQDLETRLQMCQIQT